MNALDFIKQSIDTKQKELTKLPSLGEFNNDVNRICTDSWTDYHEGYGDVGYGDGWQDYTVSE